MLQYLATQLHGNSVNYDNIVLSAWRSITAIENSCPRRKLEMNNGICGGCSSNMVITRLMVWTVDSNLVAIIIFHQIDLLAFILY